MMKMGMKINNQNMKENIVLGLLYLGEIILLSWVLC
jgi:hypothetical protein